jgi:hypothetical protein
VKTPPREFTATGDEFVDIPVQAHLRPQAAAAGLKQSMVKLVHEQVFSVAVGGRTFGGMRQVSQWEGMLKLEGSAGACIVVDPRGQIRRSLDDAWDPQPTDFVVVKASGQLLEALVAEEMDRRLPA